MRRRALAFLFCLTPVVVQAETFVIGDLTVDQPTVKTTPATAMAGAGYLTITNNGDVADRLIAVEAAFPQVQIHDTKVENDVASMFHVDGVEIAPGESVTLMPRGKHIMFMGLQGDPIEEGETVPATLVFENAGSLDVVFQAETLEQIVARIGMANPEADTEMDHSDHSN